MRESTLRKLRVDEIRVAVNDRTEFDPAELQELANSIAAQGLIEPIIVRRDGDGFELVAGERRLRATVLAGGTTIDAIVRGYDEQAASDVMLVENIHRKDLNPIDEARAYSSRQERFGYSVAEIAEKFKVSVERVKARLDLLLLRNDVQSLIASGQLGIGHARCMGGLDGNRQTFALRALNEHPTPMTTAEFRLVCGRLKEQQNQQALELGEFSWADVEAAAIDAIGRGETVTLPCGKLPRMEQRMTDTTGKVLARYAVKLREGTAAERVAAGVVAHVLNELAKANSVHIPGAQRHTTADGTTLLTVPLS
ncbi:MAG: ParB/RepB/Spo0J family partition protein [Candidatus Dormibacteraeota bacterium]|nr:ParB/RepB/Spo0J family partition protein [Candidatus Dormibacteraeota bacterium]